MFVHFYFVYTFDNYNSHLVICAFVHFNCSLLPIQTGTFVENNKHLNPATFACMLG